MTHQFKFGDRVRNEEGNEFVYLRGYLSSCTLAAKDGSLYGCLEKNLTLISNPDTARLDFIERTIPISGSLKRGMNIGWQLQNEDNEPTAPKLLLRDAIDASMQSEEGSLK